MTGDRWCCATDKLAANADGFDAGWITALRAIRWAVTQLPTGETLAVLDRLIETAEMAGRT